MRSAPTTLQLPTHQFHADNQRFHQAQHLYIVMRLLWSTNFICIFTSLPKEAYWTLPSSRPYLHADKSSAAIKISDYILYLISHHSYVPCVAHPSHHPWFAHANTNWWQAHLTLIMQCSSFSWCSLHSNILPSMCFTSYDRPNFTHTEQVLILQAYIFLIWIFFNCWFSLWNGQE